MNMRKRFAIGLLSGLVCLASSNSLWAQNRYEQLPVVAMPKNITEVKKEAGPLSQASRDAIKAAIESWMGRMTEGKESPERVRLFLEADLHRSSRMTALPWPTKKPWSWPPKLSMATTCQRPRSTPC